MALADIYVVCPGCVDFALKLTRFIHIQFSWVQINILGSWKRWKVNNLTAYKVLKQFAFYTKALFMWKINNKCLSHIVRDHLRLFKDNVMALKSK